MKSSRRVVLACAILAIVPVVAQAQEWPPEPVPPAFALIGGVNAPLPWDPEVNDPPVIAIVVVDIQPGTLTIAEGYDGFCEGRYIGGLTFSVYHQFIRVGEGAITQGNSGFGKDLPPFLVGAGVNRIAGINSIGLKRNGMPPQERTEIRDLYKLLFRSGMSISGALEQTANQQWSSPAQRFLDFIRSAGKRGICSGYRPHELATKSEG